MNETQQTIALWGRETFGGFSAFSMVVRANIEMAELLSAIECGADAEKVALEVADVDIVLCQVAEILGIDIEAEDIHVSPTGLSILAQATFLNAEVSRLIHFIHDDMSTATLGPALENIYQSLVNLAFALGFDLQEVRDEKMKINRARQWGRSKNGHFQHLEDA